MVSVALKLFQIWNTEFLVVQYIILDGEQKKLDQKVTKLWFIGFTETTGNYKMWDEEKHFAMMLC